MKRVLLLLLLPLNMVAQTGVHFEMNMTSSRGLGGTVNLYFDKLGRRMEVIMGSSSNPEAHSMKSTSLILANNPDTVYRLNENNMTYTMFSFKRISSTDHQKYSVKIIGDEKIKGYQCKHVEVAGNNITYEIWCTRDIEYEKYTDLLTIDPRWGSSARNQALKDAGVEGFPVKMIQKSENMGETTLELTTFEKANLDPSKFEIPQSFSAAPSINTNKSMQNMTPAQRDSMIRQMMQKREEVKEGDKK